jgi:outer membrane protein TolC
MRQQIEIAEMEVANAKVAFETAQMKFRDGMVSQVDLLKSELSYKTQLPSLDEKINSYINASVDFKRIIGVNNRDRLQLTTQIPENVPDAMTKIRNTNLKNGLDENYTIQTYIRKLKNAVNNRNLAILNMTTPSVSLSHSLGINPLSENTISNTVSVSASFRINTPLPFSSEQVSVAKNVYNLKKAQNDLANAREQQFIDLMKKINNVEHYEKNIGIDELNVQIAEKTFQMEESLYKANSVSFLDYEDAKKKLSDARYSLARDINSYLSAIFEIEYLLNMEIVNLE